MYSYMYIAVKREMSPFHYYAFVRIWLFVFIMLPFYSWMCVVSSFISCPRQNHNNVRNNIHSPSGFFFGTLTWFLSHSSLSVCMCADAFFFLGGFYFVRYLLRVFHSFFLSLLLVADCNDSYIFQIFSPYLIDDLHIFSAFYSTPNLTKKCFLILVKCPFSLQAS